MKKALRFMVLPLLLAFVAGCSKAPEMEMANADKAVQAASSSQAAKYAPQDWEMVQDTLQAAKTEKTAQDGRFSLFRSYGKSKGLYEKAAAMAAAAKTHAEAEMARVRAETQTLLNAVKTELDSTTAMVNAAPMGKDTKAEIELMKQDLTAMQQTLTEAQAAWGRNDFDTARNKAQSVRDKSMTMKTQVEAAMAKKGPKGRMGAKPAGKSAAAPAAKKPAGKTP
ncbi:MAG: hypothetical protein HY304_05390 [candidate division Zixibacteria bacterium]|nr:hypothetical protein [candidate division Zixibacteria bacterium]